ncbi:MAG TPA: hypothetical protein VN700_15300 [Vicinamibacterales bacterium]|nr:hypothetical protein [Vicinamibacterales bacterium]
MNAAWHTRNPMPKNASIAQRVKWHTAHAKACACRPIPASLSAHMKRSGYSGTPLAAKLGFKAGQTALILGEPVNYASLVGPALRDLKRAKSPGPSVDVVHIFTAQRSRLASALLDFRRILGPAAVIWVSWPKKASGVRTDITEDTIRDVALPIGFVDVKVCAVDDIWSGLKLVLRKELR